MEGATPDLVEQAAQTIMTQVAPPVQGELLAALGTFAVPLIDIRRFIQLVTKERLMATDLISCLVEEQVEEKTAELVQEKAVLAEEKATLETRLRQTLQQTAVDIITARFPTAPIVLSSQIHAVTDVDRLQALIRTLITVPDLAALEQAVQNAQAE